MPNTTARLGLPVIAPSQAQKHVTHNEALQLLDTLAQLVLTGIGSETPPAVPAPGEIHALGPAPTGAWAGQGGQLAQWADPGWLFMAPQEGWRAWDAAGARLVACRGGDWIPVTPDFDNLDGVGVGTASDATNRLAVAAGASLFSHAGAGHQVKINKAGPGETGALLYQSGWTGHAELGLAGDNDFHLKVSADGSTWTEALVVDAMSGHVGGAAVQADATDTTAGRLARADYAYGPGNLVGSASQSGGTPTGAVIERGSNANGDYARFADGTQICWVYQFALDPCDDSSGSVFWSGTNTAWTFPAEFLAGTKPVVSGTCDNPARWLTAGVPGNTFVGFKAFAASSFAATTYANAMAIGRWF
ncbi:DUF2793 domain-containing protein [Lutimaribacter sp. EGI FJ00015]|uniref:DUF2793 domain-containing protein n=1 Tax=Lutimaribacter degradans TaxID=2945989 RepID=A0ACC5ZZW8_9RHOB|nr:DUF2793 domain-containing protein [Lutimaribacter sp. EGI FJ00013]MCM2563852.1 DUF2793 domain-containing protein [Lutimaribacter sp. EGI FJ00013]MCO0615049.1 DUF2793 domain-containing protein [Lutimaribacter sp. EGI FJ00015]MCO0637721.1 DUF2793 domain-containing protein [Lutimaribacter sp. EGI FJ00014]